MEASSINFVSNCEIIVDWWVLIAALDEEEREVCKAYDLGVHVTSVDRLNYNLHVSGWWNFHLRITLHQLVGSNLLSIVKGMDHSIRVLDVAICLHCLDYLFFLEINTSYQHSSNRDAFRQVSRAVYVEIDALAANVDLPFFVDCFEIRFQERLVVQCNLLFALIHVSFLFFFDLFLSLDILSG